MFLDCAICLCQGVTKCWQWWDERQKINYEANNDRNLTKLTTHYLYRYQIQVWPFFWPNLPPIMVKMCPMYWKWGSFLVRSEKYPKFQDFHSQILLNDFDFWQFSTPPRHVGGCGKFPNLNIFAPFGLWKSWTKKVPCPVHKKSKTMCVGFWLFLFCCCCFCCFFVWFGFISSYLVPLNTENITWI